MRIYLDFTRLFFNFRKKKKPLTCPVPDLPRSILGPDLSRPVDLSDPTGLGQCLCDV
jgi:hypothetical protein